MSSTRQTLEESLLSLIRWIESNEYKGYDPYDFLTSPICKYIISKSVLFYVQQIGKRIPLNLRNGLQIRKESDPKGLSLIILSYLTLHKIMHNNDYLDKAENLYNEDILRLKSPNYDAWGFSSPWATRDSYLHTYEPNIVVTTFVGLATLALFEATKKDKYLNISRDILKFLNTEFHYVYNNGKKICMSYTKYSNTKIADANILVAEFIGRLGKIIRDEGLLKLTKKLVNYVDSQQHEKGYWLYGYDINGNLINQLDYHQGFMIDSYSNLIKAGVIEYNSLKKIEKAANFYKNYLFTLKGTSYYRYPKKYPVDVHNQAQGIITFSKLSEIKPEYLEFAKTIVKWTIKNMQDERGYFYYQKHRFYTNKIPYMRWGQAWMMLALTTLLGVIKESE